MESFNSPFIVPLGAFLVAIVAIVSGVWSQAHNRRLKAEQRMALLARGLPLAEIEAVLHTATNEDRRASYDPARSMGNARRIAVVLISSGLGLSLFFIVLTIVLSERDVLSGAAIGIIPFAIGLGFVVDYRLQKREMERFGLEVAPERSLL